MKSIKQSKLLYFGDTEGNSGSRLRELRNLFGTAEPVFASRSADLFLTAPRLIRTVEWRLCDGPFVGRMNQTILERAAALRPDVLWVEMGRLIYARTLLQIKDTYDCLLVNTYSDDFLDRRKRSRHYNASIPVYDYIFTPREINYPEYRQYGAKFIDKYWKGYDPDLLFPDLLTPDETLIYGTDIVFAGHYEPSREQPFLSLARKVPRFKIWGQGWQRCSNDFPKGIIQHRRAMQADYRKALCGAKIGLQLLTRWNRDTQTSRSFEIPACGTMMLAERSDDHLACFEEDKEAVYFSSTAELVGKAVYYLSNDSARHKIAKAGYARSQSSGYANPFRLRQMVGKVIDAYPDRLSW